MENYFSPPDGGARGGTTRRENTTNVIFKSEAFGDPVFCKSSKRYNKLDSRATHENDKKGCGKSKRFTASYVYFVGVKPQPTSYFFVICQAMPDLQANQCQSIKVVLLGHLDSRFFHFQT